MCLIVVINFNLFFRPNSQNYYGITPPASPSASKQRAHFTKKSKAPAAVSKEAGTGDQKEDEDDEEGNVAAVTTLLFKPF